jgi:peptidoglycan/xylan/chitin deacetylase (PgdA/CDA1 family)
MSGTLSMIVRGSLRHHFVLGGACALLVLVAVVVLASVHAHKASAQDEPVSRPVTGCTYRDSASAQVRRGPFSTKRVALTFDDGPAALTTSFLKVLEREGVPATFFIVGRNVAGREAILRRALAGGSMLGNHSFTHVNLAAADDAALKELTDTQDAIRTATGFTPCLFRPPFGLSSRSLVDAAAAQRLTSILWSVNPRDFTEPGAKVIKQRVLDGVRPGSIVLAHDGGGRRRQTLAALPGIIRALKARGYRFVTVTDLLGLKLVRG